MIFQTPRLLPAGDSAILIEFADEIRDEVTDRVHAFAQLVRDTFGSESVIATLNEVKGKQSPSHTEIASSQKTLLAMTITDLIPAYSSVLVCYDPRKISFSQLRDNLTHLITHSPAHPLPNGRVVEIPTRYGGEYGLDLEFVARQNGISPAEAIRLHTREIYRVYFVGFVPGFAYLGNVPPEITAPRLETPRTRVPKGSVGIAGRQTGIYPAETPGGWRLIGRTEIEMFDARREPPALLRAGDRVRFVKID